MEVAHDDARLYRLEVEPKFTAGFDRAIVRAFRKVMNFIRNAHDERDLYAYKALRFEKLQGKRAHQRSLRLNDQFRLIVEIRRGTPKNTLAVVSIEDYH